MKDFQLNGQVITLDVIRDYKVYNLTERRYLTHGYTTNEIIVKTRLDHEGIDVSNEIVEVYKRNITISGVWYPWVSFTLDFEQPLDFYSLIQCGCIKNQKQIYNHVNRGLPRPHSRGYNDLPKRDIPKMPRQIRDEFPHKFSEVFCWSEKPTGLVVEYSSFA